MTTAGIVLAAGAGRRMGKPKALVDGWLVHAVDVLSACDRVVVVLGAAADQARGLLDEHAVDIVVAHDWETGMGASLRAGVTALTDETRCLLTLVDLPDVGADVIQRVLAQPETPQVLARAAYQGVPGHPVLLGREHWAGAMAEAKGDRGARDYLRANPPVLVECGDLATGQDVDR
ncbi:nucleotidyltransferase family protein [Flexivirga oryzae]|uniref:CTP:molybdopterin cytidylyltransferase MocA n=1 Tax=Flexivirga oryzae TaxID=1794944 RepID=A0A839N1W9_9MICO|nr:nucleotidyltransferase family protein [Flexivirga oryzae]MBB2891698.1 CTP:molybdopterin cytidylyltransferase MocA [Flexivirga oryzae]